MLFNYSDLRFHIITMIGTFFPPVVCRMAHILFTLSVFVCVEWCPTHIVLCFSFACLLFVYPLLPVSLDCPFFIVPSVFSNVYLQFLWFLHFLLSPRYSLTFMYSFSGLSIFYCPFGILQRLFTKFLIQKYTLNHLLFNLCPEASANVDSDMWFSFF